MRTLPRVRSKRAPLRHDREEGLLRDVLGRAAVTNDPVGERVRRAAMTVVDDLEGGRFLALDERHQVLVGEAL